MSPDVLGALLFDQLKNQGMSDEDAHRAAQAAVTQAFGPQGPTNTWDVAGVSSAGATGSANPAPNAPGPKLPPPSQMAANRFQGQGMAQGSPWGSMPPPLPQAPPSWMTADWWQSTGQNWDNANWWSSNWNWRDSNWNKSWWNTDATQDREYQEYLAYKCDKGKGKGTQAFPMAGGIPPLNLGSMPQGPQSYQGPVAQGHTQQQGAAPTGVAQGSVQGAIPGQGTAPTGVVHGSVAPLLSQTGKAPPPPLYTPRHPDPNAPQDQGKGTGGKDQGKGQQQQPEQTAPAKQIPGRRNQSEGPTRRPVVSDSGRDLETIYRQLAKNKEFLAVVHKAVDNLGWYKVVDYAKDQNPQLEKELEAHQIRHKTNEDDMKYLETEWAINVLRQMLHLYQGIFRTNQGLWDPWRIALPVSLDGRLVHPELHYVINANPKAPNPPCPMQLPGMDRVGIRATAAPGKDKRHSAPNWTGRDRGTWFGEQVVWPPSSSPVPWCIKEQSKDQGHGQRCLLCMEPGHGFRQCWWYWAWLLTQDPGHRETMENIPPGTMGFLERHLEIMRLGMELELPDTTTISLGIQIIKGASDLGALRRQGERLERQHLAEELDHPMGWQEMDLDQLRALRANRRTRERRQRTGLATGKATGVPPATGTHSGENYRRNQAMFEQQQALHDQDDQESDKSAVTHRDEPDYSGDDKDKTY